ncbi:hypothetical protein RDABS01_017466, partial [Bienertia sinuspersici]
PINWHALNSDGAAKGSHGPARGGGIIRDCREGLLRAFSANFGIFSAYWAELKAVAYGLDLARTLGIQNLVVQMDNKACIQSIQSEAYTGGEYFHILNFCRNIIKQTNWNVKLEHCYREGNWVADWLTNKGVEQEARILIFQDISLKLGRLLSEDTVGVAQPRMITT